LTRSAGSVELLGACDSSRFRADSFIWQKPTSDGGDWIATTAAKPMQISIDGVPCPLTGLAVTTLGWPSLRLQFEKCPRKTAVEVPLVNASTNGIKLVHWMCKVAYDSELCRQAASKLTATSSVAQWPTQELLDLSQLASVASHGATRMQIYNSCFENLDWFVISTPLGIDSSEFEMLLALKSVLAPTLQTSVRIAANIVVETVCTPDCSGRMAEQCSSKAPVVAAAAPSAKDDAYDFYDFMETLQEKDVKPWLAFLLISFFLVGAGAACSCMSAFSTPAKKPERRIKQVSVVYHDVPEANDSFFSRR